MASAPMCPAEDFDYTSRGIGSRLHDDLKGLREEAAAVYSQQLDGHWIITRYEQIVAAAMDTATFGSAQGVVLPHPGHVARAVPLESDPPEHTVYRRFLQPRFRKAAVSQLEERLRDIVTTCLDAVAQAGKCDLVTALTEVVPCIAIGELLGLPDTDRERWRSLVVESLDSGVARDAERNAAAVRAMANYLTAAIDSRRGAPDDGGILWQLANDQIDGAPITTEKALGLAHLVLFAGHSTTAHVASTMFYLLATLPAVRADLLYDPERILPFIDEVLRYDTSVTGMARTATCPHEIDGRQIGAGDKVLLMFTSGNRDERVFTNPDVFDIDRKGRPHLSFGWGPHRCLGEHIARMELRIMVEEVLRRMPDFQLVAGFVPEYMVGVDRGLPALPVIFTPSRSEAMAR
jgi:cytochrome P450